MAIDWWLAGAHACVVLADTIFGLIVVLVLVGLGFSARDGLVNRRRRRARRPHPAAAVRPSLTYLASTPIAGADCGARRRHFAHTWTSGSGVTFACTGLGDLGRPDRPSAGFGRAAGSAPSSPTGEASARPLTDPAF